MGAKLFKTGNQYLLRSEANEVLAISDGTIEGKKLSIKNCQTIELNYDLNELAYEKSWNEDSEKGFINGANAVLYLMGDKKFSEKDLEKTIIWAHDKSTEGVYLSRLPVAEFIQSLQQTEWDVEVEMEDKIALDGHTKIGIEPKLDADGCLILKRI